MKKDATIVLIFALIAYTLIVVSVYYTQSYVIFQSGGLPSSPPMHLDIDEEVLNDASTVSGCMHGGCEPNMQRKRSSIFRKTAPTSATGFLV
jgi:hypothetical protein